METARICEAISICKPSQRFDEKTPAFWAMVLADVRYEDARQAVINLAKRPRYIEPADILDEARRIADDRLDRTEMPVPNASPDDPQAYAIEYRAVRLAIRDGDLTGDRLDAYRRGEISLTGRPALTGPLSEPNPETGPAILREVMERRRRARAALAAARAEADAAELAAADAERDRQQRALAEIPTPDDVQNPTDA
jgi:hypothetical protein